MIPEALLAWFFACGFASTVQPAANMSDGLYPNNSNRGVRAWGVVVQEMVRIIHGGCLRDVNTDLDHRCGDQKGVYACGKCPYGGLFF
jgi:hypothetical protein